MNVGHGASAVSQKLVANPIFINDTAWISTSLGITDWTVASGTNEKDYWYSYDADNREVVVDGRLNPNGNNQIITDPGKSTSTRHTYDAAGNVVLNNVNSTYQAFAYTDQGKLADTYYESSATNESTTNMQESRTYDLNGNLRSVAEYFAANTVKSWTDTDTRRSGTTDVSGGISSSQTYTYDLDNRLTRQKNWGNIKEDYELWNGGGNTELSETRYQAVDSNGNLTGAEWYDRAGNVTKYQYQQWYPSGNGSGVSAYTSTYNYHYILADSYEVSEVDGSTAGNLLQPTDVINTFDAWNHEIANLQVYGGSNAGTPDPVQYFAYDAAGEIVERRNGTVTDGSNDAWTADTLSNDSKSMGNSHYYYSQGNYVGHLTETGAKNLNDSSDTAKDWGAFDFAGEPSGFTPGEGDLNDYTIQTGDTLDSIAQQLYGDSQYWYVVADANGYSDENTALTVGLSIKVPAHVSNVNDATSFQPYNPNNILGSDTPNLVYVPPQSGSGCGTLAMIVVIAVVIVASIFTAGAAAAAFAAAEGATLGAGVAATGAAVLAGSATVAAEIGTAAVIASAAIGGFVGSVVGQEVGKGLGVQDHFSLTQALEGGAAAGIGAGVGELANGGSAAAQALKAGPATASFGNYMEQGAFNYASNYAVDKVLGGNQAFSWKAFAIQTLGTAVGNEASGYVDKQMVLQGDDSSFDHGMVRAYGAAAGVAAVNHVTGGPGANYAQIAMDAFGNTLGNSIVDGMTTQPTFQKTDTDQMIADNDAKLAAEEKAQLIDPTTQVIPPMLTYVAPVTQGPQAAGGSNFVAPTPALYAGAPAGSQNGWPGALPATGTGGSPTDGGASFQESTGRRFLAALGMGVDDLNSELSGLKAQVHSVAGDLENTIDQKGANASNGASAYGWAVAREGVKFVDNLSEGGLSLVQLTTDSDAREAVASKLADVAQRQKRGQVLY